jgi:hypothetical protein
MFIMAILKFYASIRAFEKYGFYIIIFEIIIIYLFIVSFIQIIKKTFDWLIYLKNLNYFDQFLY